MSLHIATFIALECFPRHKIDDAEFLTPGGGRGGQVKPYIFGIRGDDGIELEGRFTRQQLMAIIGWLDIPTAE